MFSDKIVLAVENVYSELDQHLALTTQTTGMKCVNLCNVCCNNTGITASPIEFYPLAASIYKSGKINEFLILLDQSDELGYCVLFSPDAFEKGNWGCLNYKNRGLICRLFGFGYRLNRDGLPQLVTCKVMKNSCPEAVAKANQLGISSIDDVPLFRNYSMQLYSIDPDLSLNQLPINQAIRIAIEKLYFSYTIGMEPENAE